MQMSCKIHILSLADFFRVDHKQALMVSFSGPARAGTENTFTQKGRTMNTFTANAPAQAPKRKRGFGIESVALGVIAGIAILVAGVLAFQQVTTNSATNDIISRSVLVSAETRIAFRSKPAFVNSAGEAALVDITADINELGLEEANFTTPPLKVDGAGDTFTLTFTSYNTRICQRVLNSPNLLGSNIISVGGGNYNPIENSFEAATDKTAAETACNGGTLAIVYGR